MSGLAQQRERAQRLATRVVSLAIGVLGATLVLLAFFLTYQGGAAFLFLSVLIFVAGAALALVGFFFQLVPFKLAQLAQNKRDYDRREKSP